MSWESAAQDYLCALFSSSLFSEIRDYSHIITRFGLTGVIYSYRYKFDENTDSSGRWIHRLIFDPVAPAVGLFRDVDTDGDIFGYQSVLASCVLKEIICYENNLEKENEGSYDSVEITEKIIMGIKKSIKSCQQIFLKGFGQEVSDIENYWDNLPDLLSNIISVTSDAPPSEKSWELIGNETIPAANPDWTILVQSAEYQLLTIAETLVFKGINEAINNPKYKKNGTTWAPVVEFGHERKLTVVDRREIESYRVIHGLIRRAITGSLVKNTLSIAVFGPPGSGKSSTVKKLVSSAAEKVELVTINMTEIKNQQMLEDMIAIKCWDKYKVGQVPILFFDEFDCKLGDEELGWLKFFLKPMQDMSPQAWIEKSRLTEEWRQRIESKAKLLEFMRTRRTDIEENKIGLSVKQIETEKEKLTAQFTSEIEALSIERADLSSDQIDQLRHPVFIFAGGTSFTYRDFCREDSSWTEEQNAHYKMAKGPDFVSRLRGHIDILGPNRVDDNDDAYVIRRAILLRSMLEVRLENELQEDLLASGDLSPYVESSIVRAMLKVSSFKHGARSMGAILNMSFTIGGTTGKLVGSTLPTLPQLNMHVNGKEFLNMVIEESQRQDKINILHGLK